MVEQFRENVQAVELVLTVIQPSYNGKYKYSNLIY